MKNTVHADWSQWTPSPQQTWDRRKVTHLFRRAGFGANREEVDSAVKQGMLPTVDRLFSQESCPAFDREMKPMERILTSSQDPLQLAACWLLRMRQTPCQLLEKMTLFWHGHFATNADKVQNSRAMLNQNRLLRENALGKFAPMVEGVSRDVAMLIYLDSRANRKTRPNENYARELMELFCLGPGNYSEQDIKEIARCFTGWEVRRGEFRFNKYQHDKGVKSFLGTSGKFTGDDAVKIVLAQPAASRFIAKKLIRYLVVDDIELTGDICQPIADQLRETDFDIGRAIRTILTSRFFYSDQSIGHKVRSPVEMSIGLLRTLDASIDMNELANRVRGLGHLPLFPPNVKGWEGGRRWINASTYFGRANLVRDIVTGGDTIYSRGELSSVIKVNERENPAQWVADLLNLLVAVPVPQSTTDELIAIAAVENQDLNERVSNVISAIGALPEFQLG